MNTKLIKNSLFVNNSDEFEEIQNEANAFLVNYCGQNIIQDDIFLLTKNYAQRHGVSVHMFWLPVKDFDFCAFCRLFHGEVYVMINSLIPLSKQIFACAHELYHIIQYIKNPDDNQLLQPTVQYSDEIEISDLSLEDQRANAFAALILVPKDALLKQMDIFTVQLPVSEIGILTLMEIFAVPFKTIVLRLYEAQVMKRALADTYLCLDNEYIEQLANNHNLAIRWQEHNISPDINELICLVNNNLKDDLISTDQCDEMKEYIATLIASLRQEESQ